jgi:hypothetical protein
LLKLFNDKGKLVERPGRKAIGPESGFRSTETKWQPVTEREVFYFPFLPDWKQNRMGISRIIAKAFQR